MELIIYGGGDFSRLMRRYFESYSDYKVVSYCLDSEYISSAFIDGVPVVSFEEVEKYYPPERCEMFVAVGYSSMRSRVSMYKKAKSKMYKMPNYISSRAVVESGVFMGDNNVIFQGVQVEPFVIIGSNNIIWSSSVICHDVVVGDHSFIAAGSTVGGFSFIGNNCFLGFNSTIIQNITVADESLVGACSLVTSNTNSFSRNIGVPAKEVALHVEEGIKIK
ncbi:acetyltransferase [Pseudomonas paeninsulae]|uniref:acetyltransferase n=1 Tax=Pseudomonas paeninsulae TaxID=3110772 RepID=UPI002D7850C7|nr:acetyltransferase [Pseudomonas sp. IT1137]